jgi:general stress protein YciG
MQSDALHTKRKEAGRKGGLATVRKHGRGHMAAIGRRGGEVTHERYSLAPVNLSHFAMVDRRTGKIKAYLSGEKWAVPLWER